MYLDLKGKRAVAGIRVSTGKQQKQGDSPEDQREQLSRFASNNGIEITDYLSFAESASKAIQPMQKLVDFCKLQKGAVDVVIVKSIDRFTRGGAETYLPLKSQLDELGIQLIDIYGIIDTRVVNTLDHLGVSYKWSKSSPSRKLELLEAERAKDEVSQILTRMIGAEVRFTRIGYWMRAAPYGFKAIKQNTSHGKRTILVPEETESYFIRKIFELKASGTMTDTQICHEINKFGFKSRLRVFRDKTDRTKIVKEVGGDPMKNTNLARYYQTPIYAGIIQEKWTAGQAVKGQMTPIVSIELYNQANRGYKRIIETTAGVIIKSDERPSPRHLESERIDLYPFRKVVLCPKCRKPFIGSASTGKSGKRYPAYICRRGHMLRIPKPEFEETVRQFVSGLQVSENVLGDLHKMILGMFEHVEEAQLEDEKAAEKRVEALRSQVKNYIRKISIMESETAIRYMEEEMEKVQTELVIAESKTTKKTIPEDTDAVKIAKYLTYFVTHLSELVFDLCSTLQRTNFFSLIFNETPNYDILKSHTPKTALPPEVNELFGIKNINDSCMVISRRIELRLPG